MSLRGGLPNYSTLNDSVNQLIPCLQRSYLFSPSRSLIRISITMKILVLIQLLSNLFLAATACTEIRLKAEDNSTVVGRTMEYRVSLLSNIIVEPKGYSRTAALPANCAGHPTPLKWQHKYTVAYVNAFKLPVGSDGMNSAGLSVGCLLFPGFAKYQVF